MIGGNRAGAPVMAESMLGGILGEEDERAEGESPEALARAEAFAAAITAKLAGSDPEVARDTSAFLEEQTELLKVQREHLRGEYAARLHLLQGQAREVDLRRFGLRLRVGFQLFLVLVATVIYTIIKGLSVWQAYRENEIQSAVASTTRDQVAVAREG